MDYETEIKKNGIYTEMEPLTSSIFMSISFETHILVSGKSYSDTLLLSGGVCRARGVELRPILAGSLLAACSRGRTTSAQ